MVKRKSVIIEEDDDEVDHWGPAEGQEGQQQQGQQQQQMQGQSAEESSTQLTAQEVEEIEAAKRSKIPLGYPKVTAAYERAGMEYKPTSDDIGEYRWKLKAYDEMRKTIDQIYRVKLGNKEWLLYNETSIARDKMGNKLTHSKLVGRYNYPEFNYRYDEESGSKVGTEKVGDKVMYEIPFSKENLEKILAKDTEGTQPILVLQAGTQKYGGYTLHEFQTRSFEDLLAKGRTGIFPTSQQTTTTNQEQSSSAAGKAMVKEVKKGLVKIEGEGEESKKANDMIIGSAVNSGTNEESEQ